MSLSLTPILACCAVERIHAHSLNSMEILPVTGSRLCLQTLCPKSKQSSPKQTER